MHGAVTRATQLEEALEALETARLEDQKSHEVALADVMAAAEAARSEADAARAEAKEAASREAEARAQAQAAQQEERGLRSHLEAGIEGEKPPNNIGHNNHKQRIRYTLKLKEEVEVLTAERARVAEELANAKLLICELREELEGFKGRAAAKSPPSSGEGRSIRGAGNALSTPNMPRGRSCAGTVGVAAVRTVRKPTSQRMATRDPPVPSARAPMGKPSAPVMCAHASSSPPALIGGSSAEALPAAAPTTVEKCDEPLVASDAPDQKMQQPLHEPCALVCADKASEGAVPEPLPISRSISASVVL